MEALKNYQILFDSECPMCTVYTKALVSTGILEQDGREAYQNITPEVCPMLDRQRAVNEIALINRETGEVSYGIHSLFKMFSIAIPALKPLFQFGPFIWVISKVYALISYNRRVIAPIADTPFQIQPTFKLHYRLAYLLFTWSVAAFIASRYIKLMPSILLHHLTYNLYLFFGGLMLFQTVITFIVMKGKKWAYLGNLGTILFAGAILLLPLLFLSIWVNIAAFVVETYLLVVSILMIFEHIRRMKILNFRWFLTLSGLFYVIIVWYLYF